MSKKDNYFHQKLGLDNKTSEAIRLLMEKGHLEALLLDTRKSLEAEKFQGSVKPGGIISDPLKEALIRRGFTPEQAEEWLQMS
tara:strand:- start:199 stop:447 length:249 start_codon:yes stop_codon:yes gene_type:complete